MSTVHQIEGGHEGERRTTVVYGKLFAFLGLVSGVAMVFGTPGIMLLFHEGLGSHSQTWVESLPAWTVPAMLCIGMGGGVLLALLSVLFGLLIPSRIDRTARPEDRERKATRYC